MSTTPTEPAQTAGAADDGTPLAAPTICAAFQRTIVDHADRVALRTLGGETVITWAEYGRQVEALAAGLAGLGLGDQDTMAIHLTNRPEFHLLDMAAMHVGAVPFSVYNTSSAEQVCHRLETAGSRIYVTERAFLPVAREAIAAYGGVEHLIVVDGPQEGGLGVEDIASTAAPEGFRFEETWRAVAAQDIVTLIYTSGTTGPPKAAQLSHGGVMGTLRSLDRIIPLPRRAMVSFLPMAHVAERTWTQYMPLAYGAASTCCPKREEVFACMIEAKPDLPFMVPRLWDKVRGAVLARTAGAGDDERATWERRIEAGLERVRAEQEGRTPSPQLVAEHEAAKEAFRPILGAFGLDRVSVAFMGGAPCPRDLVEFFAAIGLPVREAYGLTEASGFAGIFPTIEDFRIGTVGRPIPGVEIRLAEDAEILLRSDMNMVGYRNQAEETRQAIDEDGWLHTGDIGEIDEDGYVKIIDRKKDLIINAYGKNMSPVLIEEAVRAESSLIGAVVAIGDSRPFNVALVTLDPEMAAAYAERNGLAGRTVADLAADERVLAEAAGAIERANGTLSRAEHIRRFRLLGTEWMPDSEELTPTMKLKRKPIAAKYADVIDELYTEASS